MRAIVKIVLTIGFLGAVAVNATAQNSVWATDSGPSLFQSLGIQAGTTARSQILPPVQTQFTIVNKAPRINNTYKTSVLFVETASQEQILQSDVPAPRSAVTMPPSRDTVLKAGTRSVSPRPAVIVPQAEQVGGEAVLMTQAEPIVQVASPVAVVPPAQISVLSTMGDWAQILSSYAKMDTDGLMRFDYAGLKASAQSTAMLARYIKTQSAKMPSTMGRNEAMAYWANLYNALTVQIVAENYPVPSIRKIKSGYRAGPWKLDLVKVEGKTLSLDDIEHGIMRPTFNTPLVHYMVNCASVGCPNLKASPWQAATLEADQEAAARAYINSPRGASFSKGRLKVSSIYRWFKKDFGVGEAGVLAHLTKYADEDLRASLSSKTKIDKYDYDWGVNAP